MKTGPAAILLPVRLSVSKNQKLQIKTTFQRLPLEGELSPKATDEVEKRRFCLQYKCLMRTRHLIRFALRTTFSSRRRLFMLSINFLTV